MTTQLEGLKKFSKVVADTGDLEAIKKYQPVDATTNPSLILKAFDLPGYKELIDTVVKEAAAEETGEGQVDHIIDRLSVAMGTEISKIVPGRVSTEVAARLSYDKDASIAKARKLIDLYKKAGVSSDKVLIKLASTWEGIQAAEILEKEGIQCNLTLLFSDAQARACFEAGVFLISPFVGRVLDWYKKETGTESYSADEDPGVKFVRGVAKYASERGYETIVMGASFRNTDEILALAGLNRLTISPALLEEMSNTEGEVESGIATDVQKVERGERITEAEFRWQHSADPMANDKLAEGIRNFAKDTEKLADLIRKKL